MHILQKKLLQLISNRNIAGLKLREIGELIGEKHPQKVKHHLNQLKERGLVVHNKLRNVIARVDANAGNKKIVSIPILGSASCGPAHMFADENLEGYLKVSTKLIKPKKRLFALKAIGSSMNKAKINNKKNIEDGDYVIIDVENKNPDNGDYILSIVDNCGNIKKFVQDNKNKQVVLLSESTQDFPPIHIHPHETSYFINGKVVDVIKNYQ